MLLIAGLIGKCALADAKSDMMIETVSDVQMKCWMGCFGALAAEFPTVPGTARLIESTEENRTKRAAAFSENFKKIFGEACAPLDKILSLIQTNENFCVGEELTLADIHLVKLYVFSKDSILGNDFEKNCPKTFKVVEEDFCKSNLYLRPLKKSSTRTRRSKSSLKHSSPVASLVLALVLCTEQFEK